MDLISREEVLGYLQCEVNFWKDEDEKVHKVADIIKFEIEELPIIESRQKGEWKQVSWKSPIPREIELVFHYKCDNCDKEVRIDRIEQYNYCPHCGADMRGEE